MGIVKLSNNVNTKEAISKIKALIVVPEKRESSQSRVEKRLQIMNIIKYAYFRSNFEQIVQKVKYHQQKQLK